jgi:glycosyltransferase involved in cell wall biosynthesis
MNRVGGVQVLVVDDGSGPQEAQATRTLVNDLRADHPALLPLLELPDNRGKGGAVYAGWAEASPDVDWLGFVDADGSCSPRETARLIELAHALTSKLGNDCLGSETAPALFASRVKMLGRRVDRQFKRHLIGRVYATLVSELLHIPVYDSQCGLKLVPHVAYAAIRSKLSIGGFAFDVDLLTALLDHGTAVEEVPIDWQETPGGKVRLIRDSLRMFRDVLSIRRHRQPRR